MSISRNTQHKKKVTKEIPRQRLGGTEMTLTEISTEYRNNAEEISKRVAQLEARRNACQDRQERGNLDQRVRVLNTMLRETRELAVLTERYYERGYRRNAKYTL